MQRLELKEAVKSMRKHFNKLHRPILVKLGRLAKDSKATFCKVYR
jgi:hypothetical protein